MAYEKAYELIGFVNGAPPSLGSTNLTKIDSAINTIDNRVIAVDEKATDAYDNSARALSGIAVVRDLYATKEEVTESIAELESEVAETYATKAEVEEVSETVSEIATEVSNGKADVILANASGESIHLTDSTDNKAVEFALLGKATQNGTPATEAPIDVTVSGADGSVEVKSLGKNILNPAWLPTKTVNGVTLTNNGDNTWAFSGASSGENFGFAKTFTKDNYPEQFRKAGTYTLSLVGLELDSNSQNFYLNLYYNGKGHTGALDSNYTNKYSFNITEEMLAYDDFRVDNIGFWFKAGKTLKTGTVGVQIEYGETATEFEQFKESTTNISTPNGLAGINGVCDEKRVYADGTGQYIQRIGKAVFDGSDDEGWTIGTTLTAGRNRFICSSISNGKADGNILCNALTRISYSDFYNTKANNVIALHSPNGTIQCVATDFADVTSWKSYLASNPMTVWYELAEPIVTDLTAEEIAELEVQTFYPTTNILNDANCGMEVTYKADTRNYIDRIIGERISAIETALINNI